MGMASGAQDELWHSVETANFGQYFRTSSSMNLAGSQRAGRQPSIPLRLYIKSGKGGCLSYPQQQACLGLIHGTRATTSIKMLRVNFSRCRSCEQLRLDTVHLAARASLSRGWQSEQPGGRA